MACRLSQRIGQENGFLYSRDCDRLSILKMLTQHFIDAISQRRRCVMPGLSLPAPSLSGRPASLRALPERSPTWLSKRLICMVLPVIARAVCGVRSNFLPELREALPRGRGLDAGR